MEIMAKTYTGTAERGTSGVWVLECAELGAVSHTKRLAHAADEMREAMAYQAGVNPDEVNNVVDVVLPANDSELKVRAEEQAKGAATYIEFGNRVLRKGGWEIAHPITVERNTWGGAAN